METCYIAFCSLTATILTWIAWFLFYRPYNLVQEFSDVGYDRIDVSNLSKRKKNLVNFLLKRRKAGNLPPPYPNSWYSILRSDELKRKQVVELYLLGQNLVVWRGEESGQAFVADAYCPHLGAHLGNGGVVNGNCITCPFHQWSFDGQQNGAVVNVPYSKKLDLIKTKLPGLNLWRVMESNEIIWIWYHEHNKNPTWFPQPFIEIDDKIKWYYHGRADFQVTCHIQDILENLADVAHFGILHGVPAFFPVRLNSLIEKFVKHKFRANWTPNEDTEYKHESFTRITHNLEIFGRDIKYFTVEAKIRLVGAGMVVQRFESTAGTLILITAVTPIGPLLNQIIQRFYSDHFFAHPLDLAMIHGEAQQLSRDVEVWNRKCFMNKPNLAKEDYRIKLYRKWYSQFYSDSERKAHLSEQSYVRNGGNKFEF